LETGALDEAERQFRTLIGVAIDGAQAFLETLMAGLGSVLLVRKQGSALQQLISRNPTTKTEFWQLLLATNHHARGEWTDALHQYQALWPQKLSFLQRERLHLRWTCLALTSGLPGPPDLGARQPSALLRSARERVIGTPTTAEVAESFEGRLVELLLTAK